LKELIKTFPSKDWDVPQDFNLLNNFLRATPRKIVIHVLLHEIRHWAQICTLFRLNGLTGEFHDFLFSPVCLRSDLLRHLRQPGKVFSTRQTLEFSAQYLPSARNTKFTSQAHRCRPLFLVALEVPVGKTPDSRRSSPVIVCKVRENPSRQQSEYWLRGSKEKNSLLALLAAPDCSAGLVWLFFSTQKEHQNDVHHYRRSFAGTLTINSRLGPLPTLTRAISR
jgi:DinB family